MATTILCFTSCEARTFIVGAIEAPPNYLNVIASSAGQVPMRLANLY